VQQSRSRRAHRNPSPRMTKVTVHEKQALRNKRSMKNAVLGCWVHGPGLQRSSGMGTPRYLCQQSVALAGACVVGGGGDEGVLVQFPS